MRVWQFVTIILVALLAGLAFAHVVATCVLAFLVRRQRRALWSTSLAAAALLLAFPVVFFWLVAPANAAFRGAVGNALPANWSDMRDSWELDHTLRFVLVWDKPNREGAV